MYRDETIKQLIWTLNQGSLGFPSSMTAASLKNRGMAVPLPSPMPAISLLVEERRHFSFPLG